MQEACPLERAGLADIENDVGPGGRVTHDRGAGGRIFGIRDTLLEPGPRLDHDLGTETLHLLDGFRCRGDPVFGGVGLTRDCNAHHAVSLWLMATDRGRFQVYAAKPKARRETATMAPLGAFAPLAKPWIAMIGPSTKMIGMAMPHRPVVAPMAKPITILMTRQLPI